MDPILIPNGRNDVHQNGDGEGNWHVLSPSSSRTARLRIQQSVASVLIFGAVCYSCLNASVVHYQGTTTPQTSQLVRPVTVTVTVTAGHQTPSCDMSSGGENQRSQQKVPPFEVNSPIAIPLFSRHQNPAIQRRHYCIDKVRLRQAQLLGPYLHDTKRVLLVDPSYHKNVGDHMITLAEFQFLKRLCFRDSDIDQCSYVQALDKVPPCGKVLLDHPPPPTPNTNVVRWRAAVWQGGGNWGDLYSLIQQKRIASLSALLRRNHSVISMPQSLHYNSLDLQQRDTFSMQQHIRRGLGWTMTKTKTTKGANHSAAQLAMLAQERVIFTWREQESYDHALSLYPFVTNLLVPDMAFQLGPYQRLPYGGQTLSYPYDLVVFMRTDKESTIANDRSERRIQQILSQSARGKKLKFTIVDWDDRLPMFKSNDILFTNTSIQLISLGHVVICDRLHASILCYLAGVPFVFIDQVTGKISKALRVALGSGEGDGCGDGRLAHWARARNLRHALRLATHFLDVGSFP